LGYAQELVGCNLHAPKAQFEPIWRFPTNLTLNPVRSLHVASTGKFVLTCSEDTRNGLSLWNTQGTVIAQINTNQIKNGMAALSPNGVLISVAAWTGDVRVWDVKYTKAGEVDKVARAMDLVGHKSTVYCVAFSHDNARLVTTSKDGTCKVWKIDVRYSLGEDPECILTLHSSAVTGKTEKPFQLCSFSTDGKWLVLTTDEAMYFCDAITGEKKEQVQDPQEASVITTITWAPDGSLFATTGGNVVKLWRTPSS